MPCLHMHTRIAAAGAVDPRPCIGVARQARAQVIHGEINRLGQVQGAGADLGGVDVALLHPLPEGGPCQFDDRRNL